MAHFVGLDVSVKETSVCVVDDTGKVPCERKVPTEPDDIAVLLTSIGGVAAGNAPAAGRASQDAARRGPAESGVSAVDDRPGVGAVVALTYRRALIASLLQQKIEDLAFVVDRAPEPHALAADLDHHLVQVP